MVFLISFSCWLTLNWEGVQMPCDQHAEAKPKDTELIPIMWKISGPRRREEQDCRWCSVVQWLLPLLVCYIVKNTSCHPGVACLCGRHHVDLYRWALTTSLGASLWWEEVAWDGSWGTAVFGEGLGETHILFWKATSPPALASTCGANPPAHGPSSPAWLERHWCLSCCGFHPPAGSCQPPLPWAQLLPGSPCRTARIQHLAAKPHPQHRSASQSHSPTPGISRAPQHPRNSPQGRHRLLGQAAHSGGALLEAEWIPLMQKQGLLKHLGFSFICAIWGTKQPWQAQVMFPAHRCGNPTPWSNSCHCPTLTTLFRGHPITFPSCKHTFVDSHGEFLECRGQGVISVPRWELPCGLHLPWSGWEGRMGAALHPSCWAVWQRKWRSQSLISSHYFLRREASSLLQSLGTFFTLLQLRLLEGPHVTPVRQKKGQPMSPLAH